MMSSGFGYFSLLIRISKAESAHVIIEEIDEWFYRYKFTVDFDGERAK